MAARRPAALVTGASYGIGAAIALGLARDGFDLAVTEVDPRALEDTVALIESAGARAVPVALNLLSAGDVERAMAEAVGVLGALDALVNNAAVTLQKPALEVTPAEWDAVIG